MGKKQGGAPGGVPPRATCVPLSGASVCNARGNYPALLRDVQSEKRSVGRPLPAAARDAVRLSVRLLALGGHASPGSRTREVAASHRLSGQQRGPIPAPSRISQPGRRPEGSTRGAQSPLCSRSQRDACGSLVCPGRAVPHGPQRGRAVGCRAALPGHPVCVCVCVSQPRG